MLFAAVVIRVIFTQFSRIVSSVLLVPVCTMSTIGVSLASIPLTATVTVLLALQPLAGIVAVYRAVVALAANALSVAAPICAAVTSCGLFLLVAWFSRFEDV